MEYRVNIDEANETKSGFSKIIDGIYTCHLPL